MRERFARELADIERRIEGELEHAAAMFGGIADAVQIPVSGKARETAEVAARLRRAARAVDTHLVIVTALQAPVAGDLRLVLALVELAHHGVLIANQIDLSSEQVAGLARGPVDGNLSAVKLSAMIHLAGSQLQHAVTAFASRDLSQAHQIQVEDDELDTLNREIFDAAAGPDQRPELRELAFRRLLIARCVERIGDNAVDIAEQAAFLITGERREFTDASRPKRMAS
jgi:phosphate transport system protein